MIPENSRGMDNIVIRLPLGLALVLLRASSIHFSKITKVAATTAILAVFSPRLFRIKPITAL